jgi:N-6 DNA Methylase
MTLDVDVKGDAYEGLLAKNAEDVKSGAGQYFTPRALIQVFVKVMRPTAKMRFADPVVGTGGFLLPPMSRDSGCRQLPVIMLSPGAVDIGGDKTYGARSAFAEPNSALQSGQEQQGVERIHQGGRAPAIGNLRGGRY